MTRWVIDALEDTVDLAIVSRGYGRKSSGTLQVSPDHAAQDAGDEPLQLAVDLSAKGSGTEVWVTEDRLRGIEEVASHKKAKAVVLDDAFQHRKLRGTFNLLLTPWDKPWNEDFLIPAGGLRDIAYASKRADYVLLTKAPEDPASLQEKAEKLRLSRNIPVDYAYLSYQKPRRADGTEDAFDHYSKYFSLSAIARPAVFEEHLRTLGPLQHCFRFRDHHPYSAGDLERIRQKIDTFDGLPAAVFTTAKDWMKLRHLNLKPFDSTFRIFIVDVRMEVGNPAALKEAILKSIDKNRT